MTKGSEKLFTLMGKYKEAVETITRVSLDTRISSDERQQVRSRIINELDEMRQQAASIVAELSTEEDQ